MPNYRYKCKQEKCSHEFETHHSIKADFLKECPLCKLDTLEVVIHNVHAFVKGEPKTLGMLAERNNQKLGNAGVEDMWAKQAEHKELVKSAAREELAAKLPKGASLPTPPKSQTGHKPDLSLANLNPAQTKKYIEEGVK